MRELSQEEQDQRDLALVMRDPKRYAEVSARIKERKRKEQEDKRAEEAAEEATRIVRADARRVVI